MFDEEKIRKYLMILNEKLKERGLVGNIALYGGAVMCMVLTKSPRILLLLSEGGR